MTKIMPLMFGVFSYSFPAGLNLYFVTANLFRIGQQSVIFKIDGRPEPPPAQKKKNGGDEPPPRPSKPQGSEKKRKRRRRK